MAKLRQQMYNSVVEVFNTFLSNMETMDFTENGSLQLLFDYLFLNTVLQDAKRSETGNRLIEKLQDQVKLDSIYKKKKKKSIINLTFK
jgi:hypothetical protein